MASIEKVAVSSRLLKRPIQATPVIGAIEWLFISL